MTIAFDDALRIARKSVGDMTGDMNPEVLRFESQNGFNFRFRTVKGNYDITVDPSGTVGRFFREDVTVAPPQYGNQHPSPSPAQGGITQQAAVEKALSYVGGGRVEKVKPHHGGWEIEINQGLMKGKVEVEVDANGQVRIDKRPLIGMLDLD